MVKSYVSAIKAVLQDSGIKLQYDEYLMNSLTCACRLVNDQIRTRLLITHGLLNVIIKRTHDWYTSKNQPYLHTLYKTLFSTAYFGLFRIGELTSGEHPVLARDVHMGFNKRKVLFILRTSKTHWKNTKPQTIKISSTAKKAVLQRDKGSSRKNKQSD